MGEEIGAERSRDIVIQVVESVRTTLQCGFVEKFLEAVRLQGGQEREQRSLVLSELSEQGAKNNRGEGVNWVTGGQVLLQFGRG